MGFSRSPMHLDTEIECKICIFKISFLLMILLLRLMTSLLFFNSTSRVNKNQEEAR